MGFFFKASVKELLQVRNKIFLEFGLPTLYDKEFQKSPFSTAWFGKSEIGYTYELCRVSEKEELEVITVQIVRGDRWIQISLNVFILQPSLVSLKQLTDLDGLKFHLPPNSISNMRLRMDDVKGPNVLDYNFLFRNHNLKSFHTKSGLAKRAEQLGKIIKQDMKNIDSFIARWHEIYKPLTTTWQGEKL